MCVRERGGVTYKVLYRYKLVQYLIIGYLVKDRTELQCRGTVISEPFNIFRTFFMYVVMSCKLSEPLLRGVVSIDFA